MAEGVARQVPKGVAHGYWMAWSATLLFFSGFYTLLVPLPRYLALVGLQDWQIGLILGAFGVASLVGRPLAGLAADRWGKPTLMILGAFLLVLGAAFTPLSRGVAALFGMRLLQAFGYVVFTTAGTALVITLTPPELRGARLALFGAAANVAITLAPLAGTTLLAGLSLTALFLIAAALSGLAGLFALVLRRYETPNEASAPVLGASAVGHSMDWRTLHRYIVPLVMTGAIGAGFAAFFQFAPILAERRGGMSAGALYTVYGAGIIATRLLGGRMIDRRGVALSVGGATALIAAGLGLLGLGVTSAVLLTGTLFIAVGSGLAHPALLAHYAALFPAAPGRASALFYIGFDLGLGLGSWLCGVALQLGGIGSLYGTAALLMVLVLPLTAQLERQQASTADGAPDR